MTAKLFRRTLRDKCGFEATPEQFTLLSSCLDRSANGSEVAHEGLRSYLSAKKGVFGLEEVGKRVARAVERLDDEPDWEAAFDGGRGRVKDLPKALRRAGVELRDSELRVVGKAFAASTGKGSGSDDDREASFALWQVCVNWCGGGWKAPALLIS